MIDIHGGGVDLKFPHHENEMAQSEAACGTNLANYWMHNGHVMVNGVKMSKSLGNFITAHDLLEKHPANVIRLSILKTNYKMPFDFTDALFKECGTINDKVYNALKQANLEVQLKGLEVGKLTQEQLKGGMNALNCTLYWANQLEMSGCAGHYFQDDKIDGVITLTAFGCGPDSLMIERLMRRAKELNKPMLSLTIDEHTGEAGFITRLEAFIDMLYRKKRSKIISNISIPEYNYTPQTNVCENILSEK